MRTILGALFLGLVVSFVAAAGPASHAHAQMMPAGPTQVSPDVKGTIGVGLLGAELGFAVPAIIGMKDVWPYIVFPIVGAVGGALLGYYGVEQGAKSPELSVAMLAIGMGLVIPTMVLVLARTAYSPSDDPNAQSNRNAAPPPAAEDYDTGTHAPATPPATTGTTPAPTARLEHADPSHLATAGAGLFRLDDSGFYLGMPAIAIAPSFTLDELRDNGLSMRDQQTQIRIALLTGQF